MTPQTQGERKRITVLLPPGNSRQPARPMKGKAYLLMRENVIDGRKKHRKRMTQQRTNLALWNLPAAGDPGGR